MCNNCNKSEKIVLHAYISILREKDYLWKKGGSTKLSSRYTIIFSRDLIKIFVKLTLSNSKCQFVKMKTLTTYFWCRFEIASLANLTTYIREKRIDHVKK